MMPDLLGQRSGLLAPLTRPELDALMADMEHAHAKALVALANCPLEVAEVEARAAVGGDCLALWNDALGESISRWWHGNG